MSRVIRVESGSRTRVRVLQIVALALRELARVDPAHDPARDLLALLALSLEEIWASVESSAAAWEKRGYWLKADRFREEWRWAHRTSEDLSAALRAGHLDQAAGVAAGAAGRVASLSIPARIARMRPWEGAWTRWLESRGRQGNSIHS